MDRCIKEGFVPSILSRVNEMKFVFIVLHSFLPIISFLEKETDWKKRCNKV